MQFAEFFGCLFGWILTWENFLQKNYLHSVFANWKAAHNSAKNNGSSLYWLLKNVGILSWICCSNKISFTLNCCGNVLKIWLDLIKVSVLDTNSNNPKDLECGLSCNTYKYPRIDVLFAHERNVWGQIKSFTRKDNGFVYFFRHLIYQFIWVSTSLFLVCSFFGLFFFSPYWFFFHPLCDRSTDHSTISMCKDYPFDLLRFCTTRCLTIAFQCFVSNCVKCALFLRSPLKWKNFFKQNNIQKKNSSVHSAAFIHTNILTYKIPFHTTQKPLIELIRKAIFKKAMTSTILKTFKCYQSVQNGNE